MHVAGGFTQPPLQPIAERGVGSGEESEEDEEEDEGEWRVGTREHDLARGSRDETVLKTGYLWKKGERRKVCFQCVLPLLAASLTAGVDMEETLVCPPSCALGILQDVG